MNDERILVTGATGFFGHNLVPRLTRAGYKVIAVSRRPNPDLPAAEYLQGDLARSQILEYIRPPIHQIIHLAANVYYCNEPGCLTDNVYSSYLLTQYAQKWGTRRIIFSSSSGVYKASTEDLYVNEESLVQPRGLYGMTKYLSELTLATSSVPTVNMRFTYLYGAVNDKGALGRIIEDIRKGTSLKIRNEKRDYLHVEEASAAILKVLNYDGAYKLFNIGTGIFVSMPEIAKRLIRISGSKHDIRIFGSRFNVALNSALADKELKWASSRNILNDLPNLL